MRNIIPVIFVALTVLVGCQFPKSTTNTTAATTAGSSANVNTVTVAVTNTAVIANTIVVPNTPAQTATENLVLGNFAAIFILFLVILALKRD